MKRVLIATLALVFISCSLALKDGVFSSKSQHDTEDSFPAVSPQDGSTKPEKEDAPWIERHGNEKYDAKLQVDEKVIHCVQMIVKNGIKGLSSECETLTEDAKRYCKKQLEMNVTMEGNVCREVLRMTEAEHIIHREGRGTPSCMGADCSLIVQAQRGKKRPREHDNEPGQKRPRNDEIQKCSRNEEDGKNKCENITSCKGASDLCVHPPGSAKEKFCFKNSWEKRSNTKQLSLREFNILSLKSEDVLLRVYTLPIGQGDCNIIKCDGGKTVIIFDCGSSNKKINIFASNPKMLQKFLVGAENVTVLVSHADADHYNLIEEILTEEMTSRIDDVIVGNSKVAQNFNIIKQKVKELSEKNKVYHFCKNENISFELHKSEASSKKNEMGMLMKLSCTTCKSQLLFPGDMEGPTADEIADNYPDFLKSTHYKMAHHGASTHANSENWLEAICPMEVHVSHNYTFRRYHHPRCEAFDRLMKICSIGMATETISSAALDHYMTCFFDTGASNDQMVKHRVYSTAPRSDKLCLIVLSFEANEDASTDYYCDKPTNFENTFK